MFELFVVDSLIFLAGVLVSGVVLWQRTRSCTALRPFGALYIAGTLSSYNIMVKPVHDYNLVIARTFMTHGKVVGPLSVLDVMMVLVLLYMVLWPGKAADRIPRIPKEFRLIFYKDIALAAVSLALFLILAERTASSIGTEVSWYRQTVYYLALFYVAGRFLKHHPSATLLQVFTTFVWIDAINFACGFASTQVYGDFVWQRYFVNVTIIDQDDVMIAVMYPLLLIYMWVRKSTFGVSTIQIGSAGAITVLLVANFYKGSIAYIILFLPFLVMYAAAKRRNTVRPLFATMSILPIGALFYWIFFVLYSTAPLQTRENQFVDLTDFMASLSVAYTLIGIGNGTLYDRNYTDEDQGETKAIDKEDNANKAFAMQSPVAQVYKATGLPGVIVHILVVLVACALMIRKVIVDHPIAVASGYLICMHFALNFFFLEPTGVSAFLIVKLFLFATLARKVLPRGMQAVSA